MHEALYQTLLIFGGKTFDEEGREKPKEFDQMRARKFSFSHLIAKTRKVFGRFPPDRSHHHHIVKGTPRVICKFLGKTRIPLVFSDEQIFTNANLHFRNICCL